MWSLDHNFSMNQYALAINGMLNEDEAYENAITASLEDQGRPTMMGQSYGRMDEVISRSKVIAELTDKTEEKLFRLSTMKFATRLSKDQIPKLPKVKQQEREENLTESQRIRRQQDREYAEVLRQAQQAEAEEAARLAQQQEQEEGNLTDSHRLRRQQDAEYAEISRQAHED